MAWFDFMNQANARGRDAGSIARQRLNARAGMPAPGLPAISTSLARVAGFNTAALSPLLDSAHWAKEQMRKARLIPDISSIQYRPVKYPERNRPDYSGAGERARRFEEYKTGRDIPGANTNYSSRLNNGSSTGSPAAERDYQQKVSRVAQLTAQDPELQRYEYARQKAVAAGPGSAAEQSAEDMGMQMWAKANPKLAAKVKPGQSGYDAIQRMQGVGQMGSPLNLPFDTSSPLGTTPPISPASYDAGKVAQGLGLSTVPRNAFADASAAPYAGFSQGPTLQSAPLGFPSEMPTASYAGATGIQPMGSAVDKFDPKGLEAQRLLEMFKDSIFTTQK